MDKIDLYTLIRNNVDFSEVAEAVISDTDDRELARQAFAAVIDEDVDDIDFSSNTIKAEFESFLRSYTEDLVSTAIDDIIELTDMTDGLLHVWRSMFVYEDWLIDGINERPIGISWTFDEDCAESYFGEKSDGKVEIRLEAWIDPNDVDWIGTAYLNTRLPHEKEIHLKDTATVKLVSATWIKNFHHREVMILSGEQYSAGEDVPSAISSPTN